MERKTMRKDVDSRIFDIVNVAILSIFTIIIVIPLWNVLVSSFASAVGVGVVVGATYEISPSNLF